MLNTFLYHLETTVPFFLYCYSAICEYARGAGNTKFRVAVVNLENGHGRDIL